MTYALRLLFLAACISCTSLEPAAPEEAALLDGPVDGLGYEHTRRFLAGDIAFNDEVFTVGKGLGPLFVATSCASCHAGDGKGHPFSTLIRFGQTDETGNAFLHAGGPQLQNRAIPGHAPETLPPGATWSKFLPPAVTGMGFLELVSDDDLLALADPDDADGDGISGVPNWVSLPGYVSPDADAITQDGKYIGRFGKKASVYSLLQQTVEAYSQDIGIATLYNPVDVYSGLEIDPEVSTQTVHDVVFYLQTLKTPVQRNVSDPDVTRGAQLFIETGCESCHKRTLKTGYSPIEPLSQKEFHPYTDLLLHDMGSGLDDGYTEGSAITHEWRTPPLWGLGLSPQSQGGRYFLMHDGRASTIEEAIGLHGGEATGTRQKYEQLAPADQKALLAFLESL